MGAFHWGGLNVTSVFCYVVTSFSLNGPLPALILCLAAVHHLPRSCTQGPKSPARQRGKVSECVLFLMPLFWVTREGLSQLLSLDWLESIDQAVSSASRDRKRERVTTESKKNIDRERNGTEEKRKR